MHRITERDVAYAAISYLWDAGYDDASFEELFDALPKYLMFAPTDLEASQSRPAELKWHAMLRNIAAHAGAKGNAITDGLLIKRPGGGYVLGPKAKEFLSRVKPVRGRA